MPVLENLQGFQSLDALFRVQVAIAGLHLPQTTHDSPAISRSLLTLVARTPV